MNLLDKLLLQEVKRFPICYTNRDQSVAEHSFNVAVIALYLVEEVTDRELKEEVLWYALEHDIDEIETGDIPSSFKRRLRAECPAVIKVLDGEKYVPASVKAIVKTADCLEAIYFLRHFGGSRYAMEIMEDIRANFLHIVNTDSVPDAIRLRAIALEKTL